MRLPPCSLAGCPKLSVLIAEHEAARVAVKALPAPVFDPCCTLTDDCASQPAPVRIINEQKGQPMKLLTNDIGRRLLANGRKNAERIADDGNTHDFFPVVKLFTPDAAATWLLTELDPEDRDIAFGLCDLGMQTPELGSVRLSELENLRGPAGLSIERDVHFTAKHRLSVYAEAARLHGSITDHPLVLAMALNSLKERRK